MSFAVAVLLASSGLVFGASASAAPVATSDPQYQAYGAVFPDPLAVCQQNCDPNSRGRTNATQFIQYREFVDAITYMNQKADWKRYMEVLPLDGKKGDGGGTKAGDAMWPGNNLSKLEWDPKPQYQSAGLATTNQEQGTGKLKSDLIVVRVTDENVPDADKKRYALSLSIHGIERAGAEGGIRAMEEMVTAVSEERGNEAILPKEVRAGAPSWREVLANTIIYFTLPNPDGWRRGSLTDGGVFFQRYNGNGVDPNRDWPDVGYSFRGYSGDSEPETRAFKNFYLEVERNGGQFAAGDDLHGMPFADALSYTLLPHGRHDIDKDYRLREASKLINRAQYHATKWSPYIQDNDQPPGECVGTLGDSCSKIYAQTWGSVYDTINYTTTGDLGSWFDSEHGLGADGIDNEMAFSHLDRNIAFEPHGEQLHVSGNKAIIYSHVVDMLQPPGTAYSVPGKSAYVANQRLKREERQALPGAPPGTSPQDDVNDEPPPPDGFDPATESTFYPFTVKRDATTFNGGMRIDVRATNVQAITSGVATLKVQCKGCDEHIRPDGTAAEDWITVAEDYNQAVPGYAQAGLTVAVNSPDAYTGAVDDKGKPVPVQWRALVSAPGGIPRYSIDFTSGPATSDGATAGDPPPRLAGYDVANTDFFRDLIPHASAEDDEFGALEAAKIIDGTQTLDGVRTLVLADDPLPGYTGGYKGEAPSAGPPSPNSTFAPDGPRAPGQAYPSCVETPATAWTHEFTIAPDAVNASMQIAIAWERGTSDYDLRVYRTEYGNRTLVGESVAFNVEEGPSETVTVPDPPAADYEIVVNNCSATPDDPWAGTISFTGRTAPAAGPSGSAFSPEQKDSYMAKLKSWVEAGGNLVLTDGALRALPELTSLPGIAVRPQTVYVGQTAFQKCETFNADTGACDEAKETLDDPLAKDVAQPAARFNSGMRRQLFESTPLGFAIQDEAGSHASFARQYDIDQQAFQKAGGRVAGASVDGGSDDAGPVIERTTLGEIKLGQGTIRVAGALLPQPSTQYDHPLGIEPHSLTYTGYIVFCNLVDCKYEAKRRPALPNPPAPPGPVQLPFDARVQSPLLASNTLRGRRVRLRIRKTGVKRISHLVLQYRRTGIGSDRKYRTLRPKLSPKTRRVHFTKGRIGQTYLFRIHAVGKTGAESGWRYSRTVYPYDDRGKGRRYSGSWTRVKNRKAWLGGYSRSSRPGSTLYFRTKGGGRVYLVARTGPTGGKAVLRASGSKIRRVVSFRTKKVRNRRVVAVVNRTPKQGFRLRLRVLRGTVTVDGIGVRRR